MRFQRTPAKHILNFSPARPTAKPGDRPAGPGPTWFPFPLAGPGQMNNDRFGGRPLRQPSGIHLCFNTWCLGRPEIDDFQGLGDPGGPTNHSRRWGASPLTFWNGFWGRRGRPNPKHRRLPAGPEACIQNPSVRASISHGGPHGMVAAVPPPPPPDLRSLREPAARDGPLPCQLADAGSRPRQLGLCAAAEASPEVLNLLFV